MKALIMTADREVLEFIPIHSIYADRLPPREPTLPELAERLISAMRARDAAGAAWHDPEDDRDISSECLVIEAEAAFHAGLIAQTGISKDAFVALGMML